jgi:hypothetical protein
MLAGMMGTKAALNDTAAPAAAEPTTETAESEAE